MPNPAEQHVASLEVHIGGAQVAPEIRAMIVETRVRDSLSLPATALVRLTDPKGEKVDDDLFKIGKELEIKAGSIGDRSTTSIFKGEIVAFEPEFTVEGVTIAIRAYDKSHRLQRGRKVRTFQDMSASDIVKKVVQEAGLSANVSSTSTVYKYFQQTAETDRELIGRLERAVDYRFHVEDGTAKFHKLNGGSGAPVALKYTETLLTFRPRMSAVQQVKSVDVRGWDPAKKEAINGSAASGSVTSAIGAGRGPLTTAFGNSKFLIADRNVQDSGEANKLAESALNQLSEAYVEADGTCLGNPAVRAGKKVKIEGVGTKLSGTYVVSASDHVYRSGGYKTSFSITGRSERSLLDLVHPPEKRDWGRNLVVGVVTNVNDPDKVGRIKVKFPVLPDNTSGQPIETTWARVLAIGAGNARGALMLPRVNDEVVVAFENGDTRRPLVIGSVFNGRDKPGDEILSKQDGSFVVASDEEAKIHTKKDLTFKSDQKMIIEITQDRTEKSKTVDQKTDQGFKLKTGSSYEVEASSSVTIKGASISVQASGSLELKGSTVTVEAQGPATFKGATVDIQGSAMTNIKGAIVNLG